MLFWRSFDLCCTLSLFRSKHSCLCKTWKSFSVSSFKGRAHVCALFIAVDFLSVLPQFRHGSGSWGMLEQPGLEWTVVWKFPSVCGKMDRQIPALPVISLLFCLIVFLLHVLDSLISSPVPSSGTVSSPEFPGRAWDHKKPQGLGVCRGPGRGLLEGITAGPHRVSAQELPVMDNQQAE